MKPPVRLVLASSSPRRRVLLRRAGFEFAVHRPDVDEAAQPGESPTAMVERLATAKAVAGADAVGPGHVVLGADTAVVFGGRALGKPEDAAEAVDMLIALGGRDHRVVTGYCITAPGNAGPVAGSVATTVTFRRILPEEAGEYVATGEPLDKAGAYAIQGLGRGFVSRVQGSFTNVMGLPMETITPLLVDHGVAIRRHRVAGP